MDIEFFFELTAAARLDPEAQGSISANEGVVCALRAIADRIEQRGEFKGTIGGTLTAPCEESGGKEEPFGKWYFTIRDAIDEDNNKPTRH